MCYISVTKQEVVSGENNTAESRRRFGPSRLASCGRRRATGVAADPAVCLVSSRPTYCRAASPAALQAIASPGYTGAHHHARPRCPVTRH